MGSPSISLPSVGNSGSSYPLPHIAPCAWSSTMGCIHSKSKVLDADSPAPIAVKPMSKQEKKQKCGLDSPGTAEDAAPWVKGTGRTLSEKDGMIIITGSHPSES